MKHIQTASRSSKRAALDADAGPAVGPPGNSGVTAAMAIAETAAWLDRVVIGLDLCPFAKAARQQQRVRFVHTPAFDADALLDVLGDEIGRLMAATPGEIETTLLIHPHALTDFGDYNDFLDMADAALQALGAEGTLQVASFHPHYRFEGTQPDDIANATNRSPWPMLQLLREDSIAAATRAFPPTATIYEANIATMEALGAEGWAALQAECRRDAETTQASATGAATES